MEMTKRRGLGFAIAAAVTAFALAFSLAGCSGGQKEASDQKSDAQAEASATRTFTDSLGREVELPAQIDRAAASGPLAQNVLLTIAPEKMVGLATKIADDQAKYLGSEYASLDVFGQIYGSKGDFNKEAVAAADPQVVIDVGEAKDGMKDDLDTLQEQIGIPVVHIASSLDSYDKAYTMLGELLGTLRDDDLLIITADHGNDPTYTGTDHTREKVPFLAYARSMQTPGALVEADTFAVIGATITDNFGIAMPDDTVGHSILGQLN